VLQLTGLPPDTPVRAKGLDTFFRDATREESWHDDQEKRGSSASSSWSAP